MSYIPILTANRSSRYFSFWYFIIDKSKQNKMALFFSIFLLPISRKFRFIWSEWLIVSHMGHIFENFRAFQSVIDPTLRCLLGM